MGSLARYSEGRARRPQTSTDCDDLKDSDQLPPKYLNLPFTHLRLTQKLETTLHFLGIREKETHGKPANMRAVTIFLSCLAGITIASPIRDQLAAPRVGGRDVKNNERMVTENFSNGYVPKLPGMKREGEKAE